MKQNEPTQTHADNQVAIGISNDPVFSCKDWAFHVQLVSLRRTKRVWKLIPLLQDHGSS